MPGDLEGLLKRHVEARKAYRSEWRDSHVNERRQAMAEVATEIERWAVDNLKEPTDADR